MDLYSYGDIEKALRSERDEDTVEVRILRPNELYTKRVDARDQPSSSTRGISPAASPRSAPR